GLGVRPGRPRRPRPLVLRRLAGRRVFAYSHYSTCFWPRLARPGPPPRRRVTRLAARPGWVPHAGRGRWRGPGRGGPGGGGGGRAVAGGGGALDDADGVLIRMMPPGTLEQVIYRMDALHRLERAGVPLLNAPRAVEISVDKYLSLALIEGAGLPVPPTFAAE